MAPRLSWPRSILLAMFSFALGACASMLPEGRLVVSTPWDSYAAGQAIFEQIVPGKTTLAELKALGVDPHKTPNVAVLGQADMLRRLAASSSLDLTRIDPALLTCLSAVDACLAYEVEQSQIQRKRIGNFWADFLNFRRRVDVTGWQFDAIFVIRGELVIYKLWSGKPNIHQSEDEKNPLGPLQGIGPSILMR